MKKFTPLILIFSFIVLAGGLYGFVKASSLPSLIMSSTFSLILMVSAYYIHKEKDFGLYLATFAILSLHLFFLFRFFKSLKMMPAGMMVLLSTAVGAPIISYLTKKVKEVVSEK